MFWLTISFTKLHRYISFFLHFYASSLVLFTTFKLIVTLYSNTFCFNQSAPNHNILQHDIISLESRYHNLSSESTKIETYNLSQFNSRSKRSEYPSQSAIIRAKLQTPPVNYQQALPLTVQEHKSLSTSFSATTSFSNTIYTNTVNSDKNSYYDQVDLVTPRIVNLNTLPINLTPDINPRTPNLNTLSNYTNNCEFLQYLIFYLILYTLVCLFLTIFSSEIGDHFIDRNGKLPHKFNSLNDALYYIKYQLDTTPVFIVRVKCFSEYLQNKTETMEHVSLEEEIKLPYSSWWIESDIKFDQQVCLNTQAQVRPGPIHKPPSTAASDANNQNFCAKHRKSLSADLTQLQIDLEKDTPENSYTNSRLSKSTTMPKLSTTSEHTVSQISFTQNSDIVINDNTDHHTKLKRSYTIRKSKKRKSHERIEGTPLLPIKEFKSGMYDSPGKNRHVSVQSLYSKSNTSIKVTSPNKFFTQTIKNPLSSTRSSIRNSLRRKSKKDKTSKFDTTSHSPYRISKITPTKFDTASSTHIHTSLDNSTQNLSKFQNTASDLNVRTFKRTQTPSQSNYQHHHKKLHYGKMNENTKSLINSYKREYNFFYAKVWINFTDNFSKKQLLHYKNEIYEMYRNKDQFCKVKGSHFLTWEIFDLELRIPDTARHSRHLDEKWLGY